MSAESLHDDMLPVLDSTTELQAAAAQTRQRVVEDIEALKRQLTTESIKDRALDVVERSVESFGARLGKRAAAVPGSLLAVAREHPAAAVSVAGLLLTSIVWRAHVRSQRRGMLGWLRSMS
jgi:hypothetical protein